jgi:membrane protease YdiL (CAAX protease family)
MRQIQKKSSGRKLAGREQISMMGSTKTRKTEIGFAINPMVLGIVGITFLALMFIAVVNYNNPRFPTLTFQCVKYMGALLAGTFGYIVSSWLMNDNKFVISWKWGEKDGSIALWTIGLVLIIQLTVSMTAFFQVTVFEVYAFYVSAAPAEEMLYRGGMVFFILAILMKIDEKEEISYVAKSVFAIIVSSLLFAIAHQDYYDNIPILIGTLLSGAVFGASFCASKGNIIIPIFVHALFNFGAAGNIVQSLFG